MTRRPFVKSSITESFAAEKAGRSSALFGRFGLSRESGDANSESGTAIRESGAIVRESGKAISESRTGSGDDSVSTVCALDTK